MNKEEIYSYLTKENPDLKIYVDEPMSKHTSFKIGGNADIFVKAEKIDDVKYILNFGKENNIPLTIIGNGSNLLVKDNGIRGITLQICIDEISIEEQEDKLLVDVSSGVKVPYLSSVIGEKGFTGLEFAYGIPGTIGGAIRMNAGAYGGEFKDIVKSVTYITRNGEIKTLENKDLDFSYRHSRFCDCDDIVLFAKMELTKGNIDEIKEKMNSNMTSRKEKQPIELPSAGSTFKRGEDFISAKLIDDAGLKGYQIGGAQVSTKHAGFVVNVGGATAKDVIDLIEYVQKTVFEKFGKKMETEIEIIGE